ncbi:hypothetical protein [Bradyrhizobium sp. USDA 4473]
MRVLLGLLIGIMVGASAVILAYPLWQSGGGTSKVDKQPVATTDAFYICSTKFVKDRPLVIKSVNGVAKTLVLDWTGQDDYAIEQIDTVTYVDFARREDNGFDQINLDRVTGELNFANHPSSSSKVFLLDMCEQRIPWSECNKRMPTIKGGKGSECNFVINEYSCPRLKNLGVVNEAQMQCVPTERRF